MMALPLHSSYFTALGGPCSVHLYAKAAEEAHVAIGLVQVEINRIERRYSRYRSDSILSEINHVATRGGTVEVDDETAGLLRYARTCHDKSDGLFDILPVSFAELGTLEQTGFRTRTRSKSCCPSPGWTRYG